MNFFDFIENLFRGTVYFLYNLVETLHQVTFNPRRGPIRLHRAYRRKGSQQIGPLTFLFLLYFAIFGLFPDWRGHELDDHIAQALRGPPSLSGETVWVPLLSALISTIILDGTVRLLLRYRYPTRPLRRELTLAVFEFSLFWAVSLTAAIVPLGAVALQESGLPLGPYGVGVLIYYILCTGLIVLGSRSAGRTLARAESRGSRWRKIKAGMRAIAVAILVYVSTAAPAYVRDALALDYRQGERLDVMNLVCAFDAERPYVDVLLRNPTEDWVVLDINRNAALLLEDFQGWRAHTRRYAFRLLAPNGPDAEPLAVAPKATEQLRAYIVGRRPAGLSDDQFCAFVERDMAGPQLMSRRWRVRGTWESSPHLGRPQEPEWRISPLGF